MATPAPGLTSLSLLLKSLKPILHPTTFVFVNIPASLVLPTGLTLEHIQLLFREEESTSLIVSLETAEKLGLEHTFRSRMITLSVQSSLEAVGFMAVIATKLAEKGFGVNPVSGYFHDHLFVPEGKEGAALEALEEIVKENGGGVE